MTLKVLNTGSSGNCYILTSDSGKHLILDVGIPIAEIKKGIDFDIENVDGCVVTHCHKDHSLSVNKLRIMDIKVFTPYELETKILKTRLGEFSIECFNVPHNGTENRAFLIKADGVTLLYATDFEYIPYNLARKKINVMLIELNYQKDRIDGNSHMSHVVLGHTEEQTTIGVIKDNLKYLRTVVLCHMSKSGALDRDLAMQHIREVIPEYVDVQWAKSGLEVNLNECPF